MEYQIANLSLFVEYVSLLCCKNINICTIHTVMFDYDCTSPMVYSVIYDFIAKLTIESLIQASDKKSCIRFLDTLYRSL